MTNRTTAHFTVAPVGAWDRLAIVALGAAGCALSYDALQQMAVAIHVRGFLTYLFPLVIDGFIAYGVRALLVLSAAPLRARLYVWTLFGTATAASIWANALHAVRLNQQTDHEGLRLGDTVVAILSTLAPLALAGAVHLYILITRHHPQPAPLAEAATGRDRDQSVPVPEQVVDEDRRTRRLRLVPDPVAGPHSDRSPAGDRPAGEHAGSRSGTTVPVPTEGRDRPAVPEIPGDGTAPRHHPADGDRTVTRHHPADGDRGPSSDTAPESDGDGTTVPGTTADLNASAPNTQRRSDGAGGAGAGPTGGEDSAAAGPKTGGDTGDRTETATVPGCEPTGDRVEPVPGTDSPDPRPVTSGNGDGSSLVPGNERTGDGPRPTPVSQGEDQAGAVPGNTAKTKGTGDRSAKGTGDRSRSSAGKRSRQMTEDEIVQRLRPHVPAVLKRDGNSEVTRVQLRQIMRAQQIAIRNDRLTPVLQRLRSETGSTTMTRSSAR
ncbi:DUF2637 domain-containing protein [Streptomyces sp. NPDC002536]